MKIVGRDTRNEEGSVLVVSLLILMLLTIIGIAAMNTSNVEESDSNLEDVQMVSDVLKAHSILLRQMKRVVSQADKIGDEGTIDLIGGYIRELEKTSWMLDAWTRKKEERLKEAVL